MLREIMLFLIKKGLLQEAAPIIAQRQPILSRSWHGDFGKGPIPLEMIGRLGLNAVSNYLLSVSF
jgi:hypothetical protein